MNGRDLLVTKAIKNDTVNNTFPSFITRDVKPQERKFNKQSYNYIFDESLGISRQGRI